MRLQYFPKPYAWILLWYILPTPGGGFYFFFFRDVFGLFSISLNSVSLRKLSRNLISPLGHSDWLTISLRIASRRLCDLNFLLWVCYCSKSKIKWQGVNAVTLHPITYAAFCSTRFLSQLGSVACKFSTCMHLCEQVHVFCHK